MEDTIYEKLNTIKFINMKKTIWAAAFVALVAMSCGGEKTVENTTTEAETSTPAMTESTEENAVVETEKQDTVAVKLEKTKNEIEKSTEKVDELLNDLP